MRLSAYQKVPLRAIFCTLNGVISVPWQKNPTFKRMHAGLYDNIFVHSAIVF